MASQEAQDKALRALKGVADRQKAIADQLKDIADMRLALFEVRRKLVTSVR